ncbi:MAG: hypothetical protein Q9183_004154, partial [Haloplaca sp. 2 TL-2023]
LPSLTIPFSHTTHNPDYIRPKADMYREPLANLKELLNEHGKGSWQAVEEQGWEEEGIRCWKAEVAKLEAKAAKWVEDIDNTKGGDVTVTVVYPPNRGPRGKRRGPKYEEGPQ